MTVWIFGDSFSTEFTHPNSINWAEPYIKHLGYTPNCFGQIISKKLNCNYVNMALGGSDNYTIMETISSVSNYITNDDIIILGWSNISRFRVIDDYGKWVTIIHTLLPTTDYRSTINRFDTDLFESLAVNRETKAGYDEIINWTKLLKRMFGNKLIVWDWDRSYFRSNPNQYINLPYEEIYSESVEKDTNGLIKDAHFNRIGHEMLADWFMGKIEGKRKII